jgi:hypothetical protein
MANNTEYWRVHEAGYRAMARSCPSADDRHIWTTLADRCAAMADQENVLDEVAPRAAPAGLGTSAG